MESFQQSGEKISEARSTTACGRYATGGRLRVAAGARTGERARAMTKEMLPLRSSLRRTAVAGEYACAAGIDTRE